jgi:subtilase family serine protease
MREVSAYSARIAGRIAAYSIRMLVLTVLAAILIAIGPHPVHIQLHHNSPGAARLGPLAPDSSLTIALLLREHNPAALEQLLASISDPHSPSYHHFLTPDAFAQHFGPWMDDRATVERVLRQAHLNMIADDPGSDLVFARGTTAQIEALFEVNLNEYRGADGEQYYAASSPLHLSAAFQGIVSGVLGLEDRIHMSAHPLLARLAQISPDAGGLAPSDVARVYDLGPLQSSGLDGTNQTIALADIDTFNAADIQAYDQAFNITAPPVAVVPVAGGTTSSDAETTLDIEMAQAVAPHAHIVVYEGPGDLLSLAQMFSQIVSEHRAQVLSISLGQCELDVNGSDGASFVRSIENTFQRADAEGMSVLVASGDSGAYGCQENFNLSTSLPASSPYVTAVGGTTLFVNSDGSYGREAGWEGPLESVGSGGGLSQFFQRPSWQTGAGVSNSSSNGMRQAPDVAADADPLTGYLIYYSRDWQVVGGTSAAAPLWAGLIALANQAAAAQGKPPLGFLNPTLYALASASPSPYHDVTVGGNLYYSATPGWDYCTGWGSPDAAVLVRDLQQQ